MLKHNIKKIVTMGYKNKNQAFFKQGDAGKH